MSYDFDDTGWNSFKSFNDALRINIEFLEGKRKSTPYNSAPVYDVDVSKLIYIHKHGKFLTTNGQSNECNYGDEPYEQKSYLDGYFPKSQLKEFHNFLKRRKDVGYFLQDKTEDIKFYNFSGDVWVTRYKEKGKDEWIEFSHVHHDLEDNMRKYLNKCNVQLIFFVIFSLRQCNLNMEDVLIEYIKERNKKRKERKKKNKKSRKKS